MTADVELPPSSVAAFTEALHGDRGSLDAWLEVNDEREVRAHVEAYARANVTHATAAKDAEIEALRAEVEKVTCELMDAITRADKLTEALREWWSAHRPVGWTEDQHRARPYVNLITVADKALTEALLRDQEARND